MTIPASWSSVPDWMRIVAGEVNPILSGMLPDGMKRFVFDPNDRCTNRAEAVAAAADLSTMKGFAETGGTTGGDGYADYYVTETEDNILTTGSLRWAMDQSATAGGGNVHIDPRGPGGIITLDPANGQLNIPANTTLAAMGRNCLIRSRSDIKTLNVNGSNVIIRGMETGHWVDQTGINNSNATYGGPASEADGISMRPDLYTDLWIDQCTTTLHSDGAMDIASSALAPGGTPSYATVSRSIIRNQDKTAYYGGPTLTSAPPAWAATSLSEPRMLFVTLYRNWFDHCGQRLPKIGSLAYVDSVNNLIDICQFDRDDNTDGAAMGMQVGSGGWGRCRGNYYRAIVPGSFYATRCYTAGYPTDPEYPGALIVEGSSGAGDFTFEEGNTGSIAALPYSLAAEAVPTGAALQNFIRKIQSEAGARVNAGPEGFYVFNKDSTRQPNGVTVRGNFEATGRYLLID